MSEPRTIAGRYDLIERIGSGGMAVVWRARDTTLDRDVAVKLLHAHLADDAAVAERFRRESLFAARLAHPNVVTVYDSGTDDGTPYIVMELVAGRTLAEVLRTDGPLPVARAVRIARGAAGALAHAHEQGLVHRDVKPGNILLTEDGEVHVSDFGISKSLEETALTQIGSVMGTAAYISPEQAAGREATPVSDVYALGCVLYECLAGTPPFRGDSPAAVAVQHANAPPPPVTTRRPDVPRALEAALVRALAKDPSQRFGTAAEFADALDATGALDVTDAVPAAATVPIDPDETARLDPSPTQALPRERRRSPSFGRLLRFAGVALAVAAVAWALAFALTVDRAADPVETPAPTVFPAAGVTPVPTLEAPSPTPVPTPTPAGGEQTPCPPALDPPVIGPLGCR